MSDSQAVTIPAAATAETRPAQLLKALAQHPEPLSAPALASLLAEPGQRGRLLISCASALRRLSAAPSTRSAPSSTSARRGSARTSSGTRWHIRWHARWYARPSSLLHAARARTCQRPVLATG